MPILALVDALQTQGWQAVLRHVGHGPEDVLGMVYGGRRLVAKRYYLQCFLALPDIFRHGQQPFSACEPVVFVKLLVRGGPVQVGLSGATLKAQLAALEPEGDSGAPRPAVPAVPAPPLQAALPQESDDSDLAPDLSLVFKPPDPPSEVGSQAAGSDDVAANLRGYCWGAATT